METLLMELFAMEVNLAQAAGLSPGRIAGSRTRGFKKRLSEGVEGKGVDRFS
jgi:hypothetical protein